LQANPADAGMAQDESGNVVGQGSVPTSEQGSTKMLDRVEAPPRTEIALETRALVPWVRSILTGLKMTPMLVQRREVRQKARRLSRKSDRPDAFEICDGVRRGVYTSIVHLTEPNVPQPSSRCWAPRFWRGFLTVLQGRTTSARCHATRIQTHASRRMRLRSAGVWTRVQGLPSDRAPVKFSCLSARTRPTMPSRRRGFFDSAGPVEGCHHC